MQGNKVSMVTVKLLDSTDCFYEDGTDGTTCICITKDEIRIKNGTHFITYTKRNIQGYYYTL